MGPSSTAIPQKTVEFIRMDEGSKEDYQLLHTLEQRYIEKLPDRILTALDGLKDSLAGYKGHTSGTFASDRNPCGKRRCR